MKKMKKSKFSKISLNFTENLQQNRSYQKKSLWQ